VDSACHIATRASASGVVAVVAEKSCQRVWFSSWSASSLPWLSARVGVWDGDEAGDGEGMGLVGVMVVCVGCGGVVCLCEMVVGWWTSLDLLCVD